MRKRCVKCGKRKAFSKFYKSTRTSDGLRSKCKQCIMEYGRNYRQIHRKQRKTFTTRLCRLFQDIKQRCDNPKNISYKYYGGRGIKCLFESSDEFIDYIANELQIDRIDNNGHYERGNIRLTTAKENSNNRRNSI